MATSLTRRTFLKGTGLAAAGTALAGTLAACSPGGDMQIGRASCRERVLVTV